MMYVHSRLRRDNNWNAEGNARHIPNSPMGRWEGNDPSYGDVGMLNGQKKVAALLARMFG